MSLRFFATAAALLLAASERVAAQTAAQSDSAARAAARSNSLPLITTRTLSFTTDEGTWISVDVSPDGKTIVFDLLGDLYTIPIAGGKATRITSGQGFDAQPRWSVDGKQIAFTSDRSGSDNLWIADADGKHPHAITRGPNERYVSPMWLPTGNYIVATKGGDLWMYHKDGGSGVRITGDAAAPAGRGGGGPQNASSQYMGAATGRSPRYLWVNVSGNPAFPTGRGNDAEWVMPPARADSQSSGRQVGNFQIAEYDRETGMTIARTEELEGAYRPVASPDGRWLVYSTRYDAQGVLKLLDLTTGEDRWLIMNAQRDAHEGGRERDFYPGSAFTPDSKALITSYGGKIMRVEVPTGRATVIPFTADVDQQLGPLAKFDYPINDSTLTVAQIRGGRPSPDGTKLAFTALDRLYIADLPMGRGGPPARAERAAAGNVRRVTSMNVGEHEPAWSPDGRYVAYVTWSDSLGGDIYRVPAGGGQPERLTRESAFYDKITYSPDGKKILGMRATKAHQMRILEDIGSERNAQRQVIWMPADGGEVHTITDVYSGITQQGRRSPHFGPDTSRVYIFDPANGLFSLRFDGTDRRMIVKATGTSRAPGQQAPVDEILISPTGERALVLAQHNVYMITVPEAGAQQPTVSVTSASIVPTRRLTRVGGDFIGWQNDGKSVFYSIGHTFFRYDLGVADSLVRDSVRAAEARAESRAAGGAGGPQAGDSARAGSGPSLPVYEPQRVDVTITMRRDKPSGTVVLRGARLITMKGSEVIENGDVVVKDNRIVAVGARGKVAIPAGARVIDVTGKTILPGYVDIHAHLWATWGVHRTSVSQYLAQLAWGVTTQRDPQTSTEDVLTYSDLVETGELIGPRTYSTGPGVFSSEIINSLDDARDVLRRYSDYYDTKTIKQYLAGDRRVRQWVITAARELNLTTTTEGGSNFAMNLTLMQDGYPGLEHSLPLFPLQKDVVQLHSFSGLTYTPTLIVSYGGPTGRQYYLTHYDLDKDKKVRYFTPHDELDKWSRTTWNRDDQYVFPSLAKEELTKLQAAGGRVGLGSHGEVQGIGTHWELWMIGSGGMPNHEVLRVGTQTSANAIGLGKDIGSLEAGKLADLQVLDKNPLVDIKNTNTIRYVMKNGRLYDGGTMNEIWPRVRPLPTQWWWRLEPPGERP